MKSASYYRAVDRRLFAGAITLVVLTGGLLIFGHMGVNPKHLDPFTKHISQYASSAPHGWAINLSIWGFFLLTAGVAVRCVYARSGWDRLFGIPLLMGASCIPFVAIYRTQVVLAPSSPTKLNWWERLQASARALIHPLNLTRDASENVEARVHETMISVACILVLSSLVLFVVVGLHRKRRSVLLKWVLILFTIALLGLLGSRFNFLTLDGLWQRIGFCALIAGEVAILSYVTRWDRKARAKENEATQCGTSTAGQKIQG